MMVTQQAKIIRMDLSGISVIGRATQGVRLIDVEPTDSVVSVVRLPERDEEAEAAQPVAAVPDDEEETILEEDDDAEDDTAEEEDPDDEEKP